MENTEIRELIRHCFSIFSESYCCLLRYHETLRHFTKFVLEYAYLPNEQWCLTYRYLYLETWANSTARKARRSSQTWAAPPPKKKLDLISGVHKWLSHIAITDNSLASNFTSRPRKTENCGEMKYVSTRAYNALLSFES